MTPDYVYVYPNYTVAQVLDNIRKYGKNSETIDVIYIIDELGCCIPKTAIGVKGVGQRVQQVA